jgi:hypothetical protein
MVPARGAIRCVPMRERRTATNMPLFDVLDRRLPAGRPGS